MYRYKPRWLFVCAYGLIGLFSIAAFGADAKITAPERAPVGQLLLIDGSEAAGKLTWAVADHQVSLFVSLDSKQIVVSCPSPRFVKIKQVATDAAGHSADAVVIEFVDGEPKPAPKPDVTPRPDDKPRTLPAGKYDVSQRAHDEALKVESTDRKVETSKVIAALSGLQADIHNDKVNVKSPLAISGAINKACLSLPADMQKRWLPSFGSWWTTVLRDTWDAGKLAEKTDWELFLSETILGLRAI